MTHGTSTNTFAEAALIIRQLKDRLDRQEESDVGSGPENAFRGAVESTLGVDTVAVDTGEAAGWTWGDSEWDFEEWGE